MNLFSINCRKREGMRGRNKEKARKREIERMDWLMYTMYLRVLRRKPRTDRIGKGQQTDSKSIVNG